MGEAVEYVNTWTLVITGSIFVTLYMGFCTRIPYGYYLITMNITDTQEVVNKEQFSVPDVNKEQFPVPDVNKEQFSVPDVSKKQFSVPDVNKEQLLEPDVKKEQFSVPDVNKEQLLVPDVNTEQFLEPDVNKEQFSVPDLNKEHFLEPDVNKEHLLVPDVNKEQLLEPDVNKEQFSVPDVNKEQFSVPDVNKEQFLEPDVNKEKILVPDVSKEQFLEPDVKKEQLLVPDVNQEQFLVPDIKKEQLLVPGVNKEQFLVPVVTAYLGINNQLVEYMSAAVIARATGRTLCLPSLFRGPLKHQGRLSEDTRNEVTIPLKHRFDLKELSKFVRVSSMTQCANACGNKVDMFWKLRAENKNYDVFGSSPKSSNYTPEIIQLGWSFTNWRSSKDISNQMEAMNKGNCAGISGLFPGHAWRGAFLAVSAFLKPSDCISAAVSALQARAFGPHKPSFLGVHWRFEEANCKKHDLGLCFVRCRDGSIISSGLHFMQWKKNPWNCVGVTTTMEDIVAAILDKAKEQNVESVYLATDGWIRGPKAQMLLANVIRALRTEGINVSGLWKMKGVPNFSDGTYFDSNKLGLKKSCKIKANQMVSFVEQEMCLRAKSFLGSGESTWSLIVFYTRLATRKALEIVTSGRKESNKNDYIIEQLLSDQHASGLMCKYSIFYNQKKANYTVEEFQDEDPDGWLDLEACEKRVTKGGHCNSAVCF